MIADLGVEEYWVVDVEARRVMAFVVSEGKSDRIQESQVLPGLAISLVEEGLRGSLRFAGGAVV